MGGVFAVKGGIDEAWGPPDGPIGLSWVRFLTQPDDPD